MFPFTKTDIAKMAVQYAVALKATQVAEQSLARYTSFDTSTITAKVGTTVAGHVVAWKLRPYTDTAVDIVIKRIKSWKPNRTK